MLLNFLFKPTEPIYTYFSNFTYYVLLLNELRKQFAGVATTFAHQANHTGT